MHTRNWTNLALGGAVILALGVTLTAAGDANAKTSSNKKKNCAAAEALFQATGQGDLDGDGLSDCRESRQLRTSASNPDTDGDRLMDGEEVAGRSDPLVPDSDDDGILDGDDSTPRIPEQKVEGFLDALTCPTVGVLGSITVLGTTAILDDITEFEHETCAELAAMLATATTGGTALLVEVEIAGTPSAPSRPSRWSARVVAASTTTRTTMSTTAATAATAATAVMTAAVTTESRPSWDQWGSRAWENPARASP